MKRPMLIVLSLAFAIGSPVFADDKPDPVEKEKKDLLGRWNRTHSLSDGYTLTVKGFKLIMLFEGDRMMEGRVFGAVDPEGLDTWNYTIDPAKSPKTIDLKMTTKDGKSKARFGIYELKVNELKVSWSDDPKKRPAKFDDKAAPIDFYGRAVKPK